MGFSEEMLPCHLMGPRCWQLYLSMSRTRIPWGKRLAVQMCCHMKRVLVDAAQHATRPLLGARWVTVMAAVAQAAEGARGHAAEHGGFAGGGRGLGGAA